MMLAAFLAYALVRQIHDYQFDSIGEEDADTIQGIEGVVS
jgi:hypothetical protein